MPQQPVLLVKSAGPQSLPRWQQEFASHCPQLAVRWWDDPEVDPASVRYVLVWYPDQGRIATFTKLDVVFSSSAGIEHIVADRDLPPHLPVVRMVSDELAQTIGEYTALSALTILRDMPRILATQSTRKWEYFEPPRTALQTRVGILGLGAMGQRAASMLAGLGFQISGWSRTPRSLPGITTYHGADGLDALLASSHLLVGLLPETAETRGLIDRHRLAKLPRGAAIINAGRGSLLVRDDLIAALDSGHLAHAVLDVFETEPLPFDDAFWSHPRVLVTSHLAGYATVPAKAAYVGDAIARYERGEALTNVYDPARGY